MPSLGLKTVTTKGTPVQLTTNTELFCNQLFIQPIRAGGASGTGPTQNTGTVYLMRGNNAKSTGLANCEAILAQGADIFTMRSLAPQGIRLSDFYLDSDVDGDGALVTYA